MSTLFHTRLKNFIQAFKKQAFLRILSRNDNHNWFTFVKRVLKVLKILKIELVLWLKSTRKTADNEGLWGLWWLKLVPGSTCVGCGGKIVSLLCSASDDMPGPGLSRLNCQSLAAVITINSVLEQRKKLCCLDAFSLSLANTQKLCECADRRITILMVKQTSVINPEWI